MEFCHKLCENETSQAGYDSKWPLTIDIDIVLNLQKKKKELPFSQETRVTVPFISFFHKSLAVLPSNNSLERSRTTS